MSVRVTDPRSRIASSARPPILPLPRAKAPTRAHAVGHSWFSREGLPHALYRVSLYSAVTLLCIVLLAALYDIEHQIVLSERATKVGDIAIIAAAAVVLALLALAISVSRVLTVKNEFLSIPRPYQPITREDVPKAVHTLISTEYNRSCIIAHIAQPRPRRLEGWSAPDADGNVFRYRAEILKSFDSIKRTLDRFDVPADTGSTRASRFRPYLPLLFGTPTTPGLLPRALLTVVREYDDVLQRARFERKEPTQEDFELALRAASVILGRILARQPL